MPHRQERGHFLVAVGGAWWVSQRQIMSRFQHSNYVVSTGTRWERRRYQQLVPSLSEEEVELVRGTPAKEVGRGAGPCRHRTSDVNDLRSLRFKQLLTIRRGNSGTVYDGPFDLEHEVGQRLYVRWFRIHYPAPKDLVPMSNDFFGYELTP